MTVYPTDEPVAYNHDLFHTPQVHNKDAQHLSTTEVDPNKKGDAWSVTLDIPEMDELANILGFDETSTVETINNPLSGSKPFPEAYGKETYTFTQDQPGHAKGTTLTLQNGNLKEYIDNKLAVAGFKQEDVNIKVQQQITEINNKIEEMKSQYDDLLKQIVEKIYGGVWTSRTSTTGPSITFNYGGKAAVGTINVHGFPGGSGGGSIRTHDGDSSGDIKAT